MNIVVSSITVYSPHFDVVRPLTALLSLEEGEEEDSFFGCGERKAGGCKECSGTNLCKAEQSFLLCADSPPYM